MNWRKTIILAAAMSAAGTLAVVPRAMAQSFQTYRCADGTQFIVAFYPYDTRAYMQIDGRPVTLARRLALSGSRYSGGGVTLRITKAGTTVRRARRRVTVCEPL
ncbi:MAG: MliC family protein [Bradyrhizobium sp.]|jgi:membrane-bound inhibitor of C-type lysozyme